MLTAEEKLLRKRAYKKAWYERNREAVKARTSAYQKANPERGRKYQKAWRDRNKESERLRAQKKNWSDKPTPTRPEPSSCECCGAIQKKALHLDHCHSTGVFRGWLCGRCNLGMGLLGDGVAGLQSAIDYLRRAYQ